MADILFILDSSGSVSSPNFQIMLKFVTEIVEGFDISNETVRVAVNIFATNTLEQINLNEYYDKVALKKAINNIKRITGTTNTADALLKARTVSLLPRHGDRPNVPNIVIVITDGNSNNKFKTAEEAKQLQKTAVIFSIGIGPTVNVNELKAIATGPDIAHVFQVKNFKGLNNIKKELATKTCEGKSLFFYPLSFAINVLDSSGRLKHRKYSQLLHSVKNFVKSFEIVQSEVRIDLVSFLCHNQHNIIQLLDAFVKISFHY